MGCPSSVCVTRGKPVVAGSPARASAEAVAAAPSASEINSLFMPRATMAIFPVSFAPFTIGRAPFQQSTATSIPQYFRHLTVIEASFPSPQTVTDHP
jgi:hypothetical protein